MEGGDGIRDESSQLSEQQITDKNIARYITAGAHTHIHTHTLSKQ